MAEQERKRSSAARRSEETVADDATQAAGGEIAARIDDLLDEVDAVLEENAEDFVKNYVQKGGE